MFELIRRAKLKVTEKIKLTHFPNPKSLSEIYQKTGFHYAFVSKSMEICHEWAKCRDFLHDAVRTQITGTKSTIYGFSYEKGKNPEIDLNKMRIAVIKEGDQKDVVEKLNAGLLVLNHFEKYAGLTLSTMKEVTMSGPKKNRVFLFAGSSVWVRSPFLVSMYTFLIRLGDKKLSFKNAHELKKELKRLSESHAGDDNDIRYLKTVWPHLHTVVKKRKDLFTVKDGVHDIYYKGYNISNFHNNCGILSLIQAVTPDQELNKRIRKEISSK